MARSKLGIVAISITLLALAGIVYVKAQTGIVWPAEVTCANYGKVMPPYNVLVFGESWAVGDHLFPDLQQQISARLAGRAVKACTIGFSGGNSIKLYRGVSENFPRFTIKALFGGKAPDNVIILNGVNDEVQHIGAETYANYTKKLVDYFDDTIVEVVQVPRVDEKGSKAGFLIRTKRAFQRYFYDGGQVEVNDKYRAALHRTFPEIKVIPFDQFISSYEAHPDKYAPDGIHLTLQAFKEYGAFLGRVITVSDVKAGVLH